MEKKIEQGRQEGLTAAEAQRQVGGTWRRQ